MCTFNGERYLREQLSSIAIQEELPDELVVVDDGSGDRTLEIIDEFRKSSPFRVRYLQNHSTIGIAKNFERAALESLGELVIFSDQDDIWKPNRVAMSRTAMEYNPAALLVFSDAECIDDIGGSLGFNLWDKVGRSRVRRLLSPTNSQFQALLSGDVVTGATMAIRRELINRAAPIPEVWLHDAWLATIAAIDNAIIGINKPLISYRLHSAQNTGVNHGNGWRRLRLQLTKGKRNDLAKYQTLKPWVVSRLSLFQRHLLNSKIKHLEARSSLSHHLLARVVQVSQEALSGHYHKYSSGFASMALDLVGH